MKTSDAYYTWLLFKRVQLIDIFKKIKLIIILHIRLAPSLMLDFVFESESCALLSTAILFKGASTQIRFLLPKERDTHETPS